MRTLYRFAIGLFVGLIPVYTQIYSAGICIENPRIEAGYLKFDITVQNTGIQPLYLAECDFVWQFNQQYFQPVNGLVFRVEKSPLYADYSFLTENPQFGILALAISAPTPTSAEDLGTLIPEIAPNTVSLIGTAVVGPITDVTGKAGLQWQISDRWKTILSTFREEQIQTIEFIERDALQPCQIPDIQLDGGGGRNQQPTQRAPLKISPNPVTDKFVIHTAADLNLIFAGPFTVYLYSLKGGEVHRWENQETNGLGEIHLSLPPSIATGTYLLELWQGTKLIGSIPIVVNR